MKEPGQVLSPARSQIEGTGQADEYIACLSTPSSSQCFVVFASLLMTPLRPCLLPAVSNTGQTRALAVCCASSSTSSSSSLGSDVSDVASLICEKMLHTSVWLGVEGSPRNKGTPPSPTFRGVTTSPFSIFSQLVELPSLKSRGVERFPTPDQGWDPRRNSNCPTAPLLPALKTP